ncbi:MAG: alpha/beta hydrolase [Sutterellaceae bacterium]|nr:alpha/beta hydrolase [Burkholderiaceae bacterium]MCX7902634.1 alpha/beta hydrolase [Burkholderiaceae bacterium]MDW8430973.1 alpha/beta hydrolase [Sutterellaceae bacterium]
MAETLRRLPRPDGATVCYALTTAAQRAAGRAVLLLHGLASNKSRYSEFVEQTQLSARFDLLRVDLRGHGESHARGALSLEIWADDLAAILAAEGHPRAILVGHSLGAQVALAFAVRYPQRATALALIDPLLRAGLHGRGRWLARAAPLLAAAARLVRLANALGLRRRQVVPYDLRALDLQARAALGTPQAEAEFVRRYSSTCEDLRHMHTADYLQDLVELVRPLPLAAVSQPLLALLSRRGTFADPQATARALAVLARVRIEWIDCQHWPLTERPHEVRAAIEAFCAEFG